MSAREPTSYTLRQAELEEDRIALADDPGWMDSARSWFVDVLERIEPPAPSPEQVAALRSLDYREGYLHTEQWKRTREETIAACGHSCQRCGDHQRSLDVHHLTYERLGAEEPRDLVVLCRRCHQAVHDEGRS